MKYLGSAALGKGATARALAFIKLAPPADENHGQNVRSTASRWVARSGLQRYDRYCAVGVRETVHLREGMQDGRFRICPARGGVLGTLAFQGKDPGFRHEFSAGERSYGELSTSKGERSRLSSGGEDYTCAGRPTALGKSIYLGDRKLYISCLLYTSDAADEL